MKKIMKVTAIAGLLAASASANAWWGGPFNNGYGNNWMNDMFGNGNGDMNFSMNARARGNGYGYGRGNGYGYQNPYYGYAPYGYAPYGYGAPVAPVAPAAPAAPAAAK